MVELLLSEKIFPAVCALLGALIGTLGTIAVGWLNQKYETKRKLLAMAHSSAAFDYERDLHLKREWPFAIHLYKNLLLMENLKKITTASDDEAGNMIAQIEKKASLCNSNRTNKIMSFINKQKN